jgi:tetratricopeptide (TPR) repeat protein
MKAGEKSTNRYALDEANQYYQEAFTLLSNKPDRSMAEQELLIDILNHWSLVEFYRGHFGSLLDFLFQFKHVADSIQDKAKIAMYYFWIGQTQFQLEMYIDADRNLRKSLAIAEEVNDQKTIGYACCFLAWVLLHVGKLDEAEFYGNHAVEISGSYLSDHILFSNARGAVAMNNLLKGMGATDNFETGELLLEYGVKCTDPRALFMAHLCTGNGHQINGDFLSAIESYKRAVEVSVDPFLKQWGKALLGWCYLETFQLKEAEKVLSESKTFDDEFQSKTVGSPARGMLGILNVMKGNLSLGIEMMGEMMQIWLKNERKWAYVFGDYNFGMVYSKLAEGGQDTTLPMIAKNIGFLIKNVPFAAKKAEDYFQSAIEQWTEMGAKGWVGRASLDLGHLHKIKGRKEQARKYITDAIQLFEECEADVFLKQAKEVLAALG